MHFIAITILLAPLLIDAATFTGCMSSTIPFKSKTGLQIANTDGTSCIDQCTASGYEYSYSYFHETDSLHYCQCESSLVMDAHKDSLRPAYQGETCYEGDATVYHLPTELTFTHCAHTLKSHAEETIVGWIVDTPAKCFEHCSSAGAYLLPPPVGVTDGDYECFCQQPEIEEEGISSFCDSAAYRRFDPFVKSNRLTFQKAGNDINF
ncbi:uncharacterized protein I303_101620 [Kwoniella dejecticola CBS 10117]|uniref:WSC domain-containing protein n=1 Tax=Kwoniella dejecticola CBS 10117 TaxID=1296121 RepID=A0A1A6AD85_9TREE|nr:uncharacterized protein I303_02245 [Kwoniella dejecticola CBS 10117]OBR88027.1 hypothetical protein I303_02245 [Kwoniella dejecticola CBS 10117]